MLMYLDNHPEVDPGEYAATAADIPLDAIAVEKPTS